MANENVLQNEAIKDFDFEAMEDLISQQLEDQIADLEVIKEQRDKIGTPESLVNAVIDAAVEGFNNNIAQQFGEDFIRNNGGLNLDLSRDAHFQTVDNFADEKFAEHNPHAGEYQQKHEAMQSNFEKDAQGNIRYHTDRSGKTKENLVKGARTPYDKNRPGGSKESGTDMDHTVSAGELMRDPAANLYMSEDARIAFANSPQNLNEINSAWNRSKGDLSMEDWLNHPNANGQTPKEIWGITDNQEKALRKKDNEARQAKQNAEQAGKDEIEKLGKASRRDEGVRILKGAGKAVLMSLLADFVKEVLKEMIIWIKEKGRKLNTLMDHFKSALSNFIRNLKENLFQSTRTAVTTVVTAIFGEVVTVINKAITFLKQSWKTVKDVITYMKSPNHKRESSVEMMSGISKIVVTGLATVGTIALSEVVGKGLVAVFPALAAGGIADMIGLLISGIVVAIISMLIMRKIDKFIDNKLKEESSKAIIAKQNEILNLQEQQIAVAGAKIEVKRRNTQNFIQQTQENARAALKRISDNDNIEISKIDFISENKSELDRQQKELDRLSKVLDDLL